MRLRDHHRRDLVRPRPRVVVVVVGARRRGILVRAAQRRVVVRAAVVVVVLLLLRPHLHLVRVRGAVLVCVAVVVVVDLLLLVLVLVVPLADRSRLVFHDAVGPRLHRRHDESLAALHRVDDDQADRAAAADKQGEAGNDGRTDVARASERVPNGFDERASE